MIDCHFHLWTEDNSTPERRAERAEQIRRQSEVLGVDRICLIGERGNTVEECRAYNGTVATYVEEYPDLFYGWARADPTWGEDAADEFRRAVEEDGLMGLKLYARTFLDDPRVDPLAEAAIDMDVPIISHVADTPEVSARKPKESGTAEVRNLAERFPDLKLISGHIGGGGYWEKRIKNLRDVDNVFLDTSGSVCDAGMLEMAVDHLGADRLVFGTDTWVLPGVGKLAGSELSPEEKATIAYNAENLIPDSVPNKLDAAEIEAGRERARERFAALDGPREETIVDANAYLGDFPWRPVDAAPDDLLARMDREGIDRAVVSSLDAVFYRNVHHGNRELAASVAGHGDRFVPFATINPAYPAWEDDLEECVTELGMKGVRLFPMHHDYALDDPAVEALLGKAVELDIPVMFVPTLEDTRQHHPRWTPRDYEELGSKHWGETHVDQLIDLLLAVPDADVIVAGAWTSAGRILTETTTSYPRGVHLKNKVRTGETLFVLDDLLLFFLYQGEEIASEIGAEHLVTGPKTPLQNFYSRYIYTDHLPVDEAEKDRVRSGNVLSLVD